MRRDEQKWYGIAIGAESRLLGFEGDIDAAAARLDGLDATKPDLIKSIAYLALQVHTYRAMSSQDANLALTQVRSVLRNYDEAQARKRSEAAS